MSVAKVLKSVFSIETFFGAIILGAALWSGLTYDDEIASATKNAMAAATQRRDDQMNTIDQRISRVEQEVQNSTTTPPPVVVRRVVNEKPFAADPAVLERARRLRAQQHAAEQNR